MLGLAAPTPLARKAVDVLAQTPADILTVLLLLGYIGTIAESQSTFVQLPVDIGLVEVGQRWRVLRVPMGWDFNRVHVWASMALVREELGWEVGLGSGYPFQVRSLGSKSWVDDSRRRSATRFRGMLSITDTLYTFPHHHTLAVITNSNLNAPAHRTRNPRTLHRLYLAPRRHRQGIQPQPQPQPYEADTDAPL